jgi:tetratricopeptide (TPR) repeat protein
MATETSPTRAVMYDRRGRVYQPTVGPKLRIVLFTIFFLFALLGANSVYLVSLKALNWFTGQEHGNWFYLYMFLLHLVVGLVLMVPFVVFIALHLRVALGRANRRAVRLGFGLLIASVVLLGTGILMVFQRQLFSTTSLTGQVIYWLHVLAPVAVIVFYILHRYAGPRIQWKWAKVWGAAAALIVAGFGYMHFEDPRQWGVKGAGEEYFFPSQARTIGPNNETQFIPAHVLMNDQYCLKCHADAYAGWFHSAHHFSSFNNIAYRQSILDMRKALDLDARQMAQERGISLDSEEFKQLRARKVQATRWCAGCHDPVPFFSGAFDDDRFFEDLEVHLPPDGSPWVDKSIETQPTAHAGLTCTSCHAITHVNSVTGNADYTIQEPPAYPFQYSDNWLLQKVNEYLVKAKPDLHKRSMLKPFHRTAEFCQVCHKVHLPEPVNSYKWTRGQNHYDSWHNSGASGFGARSFHHPAVAKNCAECHMPDIDSKDFGTRNGKLRNHLFLGANTALPALRKHFGKKTYLPPIGDEDDVIRLHQEFLADNKMRVDLFAVREGGEVDGKLQVLADPLPELEPGKSYLIETIIRNLGVGHEFTQGTVDSNEVWLHLRAVQGGKVIGESGAIDEHGYGDPWAYYVNNLVLDRHGRRIDRRNAKDIFVPLYVHQVPPSSSHVVHYRLTIPEGSVEPVILEVKLLYRKFDRIYQDFFLNRRQPPLAAALAADSFANPLLGTLGWLGAQGPRGPELPIATIASDRVALKVRGGKETEKVERHKTPLWMRWNDYGVGLLLQGDEGADKGLLRQAEAAFLEVIRLQPSEYLADAYLNLARLYLKEGRLQEMAQVLEQAREVKPGYFKTAWLRGELNRQNGRLDEAIADFRTVLETRIPERKFDFSKDREVRRQLADAYYLKAQRAPDGSPEQAEMLREAIHEFETILKIDPEDRLAHFMLDKCYRLLGDDAKADHHLARYKIYQIDNSARDDAVRIYRMAHPWADRAAQAVVIYDLDGSSWAKDPGLRADRSLAPQSGQQRGAKGNGHGQAAADQAHDRDQGKQSDQAGPGNGR